MRHPFQCTAILQRSPKGENILLAACGSKLLALGLSSKKVVSQWSPRNELSDQAAPHASDERPTKKQRTANPPVTDSVIIKLQKSPCGEHAVAVTGDKVLRIFHIDENGKIKALSQRGMPKRPCAIDILPIDSTVLCGDKFGDVYSLPLYPREPFKSKVSPKIDNGTTSADTGFKPTATNLTVHTKRNLKALESQINQKNFTARKETLAFEHKLLLGHVSMLTDMKYATRKIGSKRRGYIITADRDEHIRVSRAPPQSYVIEGFCLGHAEFVSKICLVPDTDLLVSGGGDDWLGIWDWTQYKLLKKLDLRSLFNRSGHPDSLEAPVTVSGLWIGGATDRVLAVTIEKVPALFIVSLSALQAGPGSANETEGTSILKLDGCPIDVTWIDDTMIVSQDVRGEEQQQQRLLAFRLSGSLAGYSSDNAPNAQMMGLDDDLSGTLNVLNNLPIDEDVLDKSLDELLHSTGLLRKRRDAGASAEIADDDELPDE